MAMIGLGIGVAQRVQTGAAAAPPEIPWYLAGGVDLANCVAAYQPKGAVDYATSKVNLANPGTHDLTDGAAAPSFGAAGWSYNGIDQYLITDISSVDIGRGTGAIVITVSDQIGVSGKIFGASYYPEPGIDGVDILMVSNSVYGTVLNNDSGQAGRSINSNGVIFINSDDIYVDNVLDETITSPLWVLDMDTNDIVLGAYAAIWWPDPLTYYFGMAYTCKAVAFYNTKLTASQVAEITAAIQAL